MAARGVSLSWIYTIREVRRRPLRSLLALVGIVLGVAAVAAVALATTITREGYSGMFRAVAGRASLEIVSPAGRALPTSRATSVEGVPGVRAAVPIVRMPAALLTPRGPQPLLVLGIDPTRDHAVRDWTLAEGDDLASASGRGLLLEAGFAPRLGAQTGKPIRLMTVQGPVDVPVAGLFTSRELSRFNGGAVALLALRDAQALGGLAGEANAIQIVLERGADPRRVAESIGTTLPGCVVREPAASGRLGAEFLLSTEQMMSTLSAVAVVAGSLVILNTFLMHLNERRRQYALLRALGATRRQVTGLLLRQAALYGGVGTLLGLPLGVLLAGLLVAVTESFLDVTLPGMQLPLGPLLLAAAVGPAMTLAATAVPAHRASRRSPLASLTPRGTEPEPAARWPLALGVVLLAVVAIYEIAIIYYWAPPAIGVPLMPFAAGAGMVACTCLVSAGVPALLRLAAWIVPPLMGVEGRLAVRHLRRQRARTGLTIGVLFAAVAACVSFGMSFLVNLRDIDRWYAGTVDADFLVRAVYPDPGLAITPAPLPAKAIEEIRALPGCATAARFRFQPTQADGVEAILFAREFPSHGRLPLVLEQGDPEAVRLGLARGEAVLGTALAHRLKVGLGDTITVPGRDGPRRLRVAGLAKEYAVGGMVFYVEWTHVAANLMPAQPQGLTITALPNEAEELSADLADYCVKHGLVLQHNSDFAAVIGRVVVGVRWFVVGLVGLIFLVAAVGVINTLATNVLDQTRELGVLRALGMKRGQVQKLILAQAVVLALASCLTGAPAGVAIAYLMNRATPGLLGHTIPFHVEGWFVIACVAGVGALAVVAAVIPARRAARLAVIDALRYE